MNSIDSLIDTEKKARDYLDESLIKFNNIDCFLNDTAADIVEYYFYENYSFSDKDEFKRYLKYLIIIYKNFLTDKFDDDFYDDLDHPIQKVVTYIEEHYDLLIYYNEPHNPIFRRKQILKAKGGNPYSVEFENVEKTVCELIEKMENSNKR